MKKVFIRGLEILIEFSFFITGAIILGIVYLFFTVENIEQYFTIEVTMFFGLLFILTHLPSFFAGKLQILAYKWNIKLMYLNNLKSI